MAKVNVVCSPSGQKLIRKKMHCWEFLQNHLFVFTRMKGADFIPNLHYYSDTELIIEYDYVEGLHLDEIDTQHHEDCFFAAGASLARFHAFHFTGYGFVFDERDRHSDWWVLQDRRVEELLLYADTQHLLDKVIVKQLADIYKHHRANVKPEYQSCLTHCDYRLDNLVFVNENGTWKCKILDFDHVQASPPHFDFGRIEQDIFDIWHGSSKIFLDGYKSVTPYPDLQDVLPLYRIIWPLSNLVWGAGNNAEGLVAKSFHRLKQVCAG